MVRQISSIRSVWIGFAGLLALMFCIVADSAFQTLDVARTSAALRKESRDRDAILDQLRTDTYRSSTLVRDYMLERDEAVAASQRTELQQIRPRIDNLLTQYLASAPPNEKEAIESLRQHAESYWNALAPALGWDRTIRVAKGEEFLRNTIVPGRNDVVQFTKLVTDLNERVLDSGEERIQEVQAQFQNRVKIFSITSLALGGILALVVIRHTQRLGAEAAARFNEVLEAREDLRRLSDRIVSVQEDERKKLSRELHDELGQTMSAMLLEIGKLESTLTRPDHQKERLAAVRRLAEENVAKVRNMALLLRPGMLDELGLIPALRWQAKEVSRRTGLKVKMIADELDDNLPDANRTCIYRVVQEALNNCAKHARANEARVVIHRDGDGLSVSVQDDGIGFDARHNKGLGLLGMMERVGGLGGRFHIESEGGRGTILSTYFPLDSSLCRPEQESIV